MSNEIKIADTEWKVMQLLWNQPLATITEIKDQLSDTDWSDSTIKTLVRRLVAKGAVGIDDSLSQFRYYPLIQEKECKRKETRSFINRIYNGSFQMLITSLTSESNLTKEETSQLMQIIEKMEGGAKN